MGYSLYFDELYVAKEISGSTNPPQVDRDRVDRWLNRYCQAKNISLSDEQTTRTKQI